MAETLNRTPAAPERRSTSDPGAPHDIELAAGLAAALRTGRASTATDAPTPTRRPPAPPADRQGAPNIAARHGADAARPPAHRAADAARRPAGLAGADRAPNRQPISDRAAFRESAPPTARGADRQAARNAGGTRQPTPHAGGSFEPPPSGARESGRQRAADAPPRAGRQAPPTLAERASASRSAGSPARQPVPGSPPDRRRPPSDARAFGQSAPYTLDARERRDPSGPDPRAAPNAVDAPERRGPSGTHPRARGAAAPNAVDAPERRTQPDLRTRQAAGPVRDERGWREERARPAGGASGRGDGLAGAARSGRDHPDRAPTRFDHREDRAVAGVRARDPERTRTDPASWRADHDRAAERSRPHAARTGPAAWRADRDPAAPGSRHRADRARTGPASWHADRDPAARADGPHQSIRPREAPGREAGAPASGRAPSPGHRPAPGADAPRSAREPHAAGRPPQPCSARHDAESQARQHRRSAVRADTRPGDPAATARPVAARGGTADRPRVDSAPAAASAPPPAPAATAASAPPPAAAALGEDLFPDLAGAALPTVPAARPCPAVPTVAPDDGPAPSFSTAASRAVPTAGVRPLLRAVLSAPSSWLFAGAAMLRRSPSPDAPERAAFIPGAPAPDAAPAATERPAAATTAGDLATDEAADADAAPSAPQDGSSPDAAADPLADAEPRGTPAERDVAAGADTSVLQARGGGAHDAAPTPAVAPADDRGPATLAPQQDMPSDARAADEAGVPEAAPAAPPPTQADEISGETGPPADPAEQADATQQVVHAAPTPADAEREETIGAIGAAAEGLARGQNREPAATVSGPGAENPVGSEVPELPSMAASEVDTPAPVDGPAGREDPAAVGTLDTRAAADGPAEQATAVAGAEAPADAHDAPSALAAGPDAPAEDPVADAEAPAGGDAARNPLAARPDAPAEDHVADAEAPAGGDAARTPLAARPDAPAEDAAATAPASCPGAVGPAAADDPQVAETAVAESGVPADFGALIAAETMARLASTERERALAAAVDPAVSARLVEAVSVALEPTGPPVPGSRLCAEADGADRGGPCAVAAAAREPAGAGPPAPDDADASEDAARTATDESAEPAAQPTLAAAEAEEPAHRGRPAPESGPEAQVSAEAQPARDAEPAQACASCVDEAPVACPPRLCVEDAPHDPVPQSDGAPCAPPVAEALSGPAPRPETSVAFPSCVHEPQHGPVPQADPGAAAAATAPGADEGRPAAGRTAEPAAAAGAREEGAFLPVLFRPSASAARDLAERPATPATLSLVDFVARPGAGAEKCPALLPPPRADARPHRGERAKAPAVPPAAFGAAREELLRDLRRVWMGAAFKRSPFSLLAARLRPAAVSDDHLARTVDVLQTTLAELGTVYDVGPQTLAVVMPNVALHQAHKVAHAILAAIDARSAARPEAPLGIAIAVAALHRDDDPATAVCLAENCLGIALAAAASKVVSETDPGARAQPRFAC